MEVTPLILEFHAPFTRTNTRHIHLQNTTDVPIAFKVKTTAPKLYSVRPNTSRVEPGQRLDVSITLQAFKTELSPDYQSKDKFQVQTIALSSEQDQQLQQQDLPIADFWAGLDDTAKSQIKDVRIKVHYVFNDDSNVAAGSNAEPVSPGQEKSFDTPHATAAAAVAAVAAGTPTPSNNLASTISSQEDDHDETADLKATIRKLEQELERAKEPATVPLSTTTDTTNKAPVVSSGVPFHTAALLCLISFILAWLFF
ncbi:PapD-like protein [Lipomyces japonicus]|uniref:PapD-like protein n=1 Tax=Lipomyces japonicus TaxID=56871 RepID=UPI0034CFFEC0